MGKTGVVIGIVVVAVSAFLTWFITLGPLADRDPPILPEFYWGPTALEDVKPDESVRPFKIQVSNKTLSDLRARLEIEQGSTRLTDPLEGIGFQYGFNSKALPPISSYWLTKYDWRVREAKLNEHPHFITKIAGIDIHFQRVKTKSKKLYKTTRPLLLLHGWPSSFIEFQKVVPLLTDPPGDMNFELVIPSLPGYGFSEGAHKSGLGVVEMAQILETLMTRLGYSEFYVQGGDWGSAVATNIATLYPKSVLGLHVNLCMSRHPRTMWRMLLGSLYPSAVMDLPDIPWLYPLSRTVADLIEESGYFHIQATKPDTIGIALSHSPSGLAAYILEKFSTGTNLANRERADGGLLETWELDELLDTVMIYWVTNSITTSMRLYSEIFTEQARSYGIDSVPVRVPTGCLRLPKDGLSFQTEFFLQDKYPQLVSFTRGAKGGHFAASEVPHVFAEDVVNFVRKVESGKK